MMLHHLITISLIITSYLTNYTRVGVSILFLHDLGIIILSLLLLLLLLLTIIFSWCFLRECKTFQLYIQSQRTWVGQKYLWCTFCNFCFNFLYYSIRYDYYYYYYYYFYYYLLSVIYPRNIIGSVLFEAPEVFGTDWAGYWVFAGLLIMLELLHIFWFYLIARMIYRYYILYIIIIIILLLLL